MKITRRQKKFISAVVFLTTFLTWFFYTHETLPKPIKVATSLLGTPTAIASGLSYYFKLGIPVYDTPISLVFSNLIASIIIVILGDTFLNWRRKRKQLT